VPADYSDVGLLLSTTTVLGFVLPVAAFLVERVSRLRSD
jgi:hypothetical protein